MGWGSEMHQVGKLLMVTGAILLILGALFLVSAKFTGLGLGRLPGDIRIEREKYRIYLPLGTSILISLVLTLVWSLIAYLRRR